MLNWDEMTDIPEEKVLEICNFIAVKSGLPEFKEVFINPILRSDIFNVLEKCCTIIFFPYDEEENDGFHISVPVDYQEEDAHFVFLNTAKTLEKQVFAAAHELGHIWEIDKQIWGEELIDDINFIEDIMSRFAAELLMPKGLFFNSAITQLRNFVEDEKITIFNIIRVIASLMNEYCVPAQAVIRRLYEVRCLPKDICKQILLGPDEDEEKQMEYIKFFQDTLQVYIKEGGYTRLGEPTRRKGIKDFPLLLNKMDEKKLFSAEKILNLRKMLDIPVISEKDTDYSGLKMDDLTSG